MDNEMNNEDLVREHDESNSTTLLSCGHWSEPVHNASSHWDFPDDPLWCGTCKVSKQWDVRLQALAYRRMA